MIFVMMKVEFLNLSLAERVKVYKAIMATKS